MKDNKAMCIYEKGDLVEFLSKCELEAIYEKIVEFKSDEYKQAVLNLANKTFRIKRMFHIRQYDRFTLDGNDPCIMSANHNRWLFFTEFVTPKPIPDLYGSLVYKGL